MGGRRSARIGISGSYGGLNLGDEAILHGMLGMLRRSVAAEVTVFGHDPEDTRRRHRVEHAFKRRAMSRREAQERLRGLDLFILGGGGILFDAEAEAYLGGLAIAAELGIPTMVYAVSAGPLVEPRVRARVRQVLEQVSAITVRDRQSLHLLEEIGVEREITVTADPALLLEPEPITLPEILRREAIDPRARLIAFSVREPGPAAPDLDVDHYHRLVANAADFMIDRLDAEVVFFPLERRMFDVQHSHAVVAQMRHAQRATVLKHEYTPGQLVTILGHFELAVGMRLHFLILSAKAGLPIVALPYAAKVSGFLEDLQLEAPAFSQVSAGQLIAQIDRVWDARGEQRQQIAGMLPALRERARENNRIALGLLGHGARPDGGRPRDGARPRSPS